MPKIQMGDKEFLDDSIASQKQIGHGYNTFVNECTHQNLRTDFMNILKEEQDIQKDLFNEMQSRGWYDVKSADQNAISQAKMKYQNML